MSDTPQNEPAAPPDERPIVGTVYQHYKGDYYTVVGFAFHHDTREELVLYRSHLKGWINARPLRGTPSDPDGWLTAVSDEHGNSRSRFVCAPDVEPQSEQRSW